MKTVAQQQIKEIVQNWIIDIQKQGLDVPANEIVQKILDSKKELLNNITIVAPNLQTKNEDFDILSHNDNIRNLQSDIKVLFNSLYELDVNSENLTDSITDMMVFNQSLISKMEREIDTIIMNSNISEYSYIENFKNNHNELSKENVTINSDSRELYLMSSQLTRPLKSNEITITNALTGTFSNTAHIRVVPNKPSYTFNNIIDKNDGEYTITVTSRHNGPMDVLFKIVPTRVYESNGIKFSKNNDIFGIYDLNIYNDDGVFFSNTGILDNKTDSFQYKDNIISKIELNLYKSNEDRIEQDDEGIIYIYEFKLRYLLMENNKFTNEGYFISIPLSIQNIDNETVSFKKISMLTYDNIVTNTYINYFIKKSSSERWRKIVPINHGESNNNIIDFNVSADIVYDGIKSTSSKQWASIHPITNFGAVSLYNIGDYLTIDNETLSEIMLDQNINNNSIILERGVGDFSISDNTSTEHIILKDIYSPVNISTGEVDLLYPMKKYYKSKLIDDGGYYITVPYLIPEITQNQVALFIMTDDNTKFKINAINKFEYTADTTTIYVDYIYNSSGEKVINESLDTTIETDFLITLEEYKTRTGNSVIVDTSSLLIRDDPRQKYYSDNAYEFFPNNLYINFHKYIVPERVVYVSYNINIQSANDYKTFSAKINILNNTTLTIYPFTEEEIIKGNFHYITNIDTKEQIDVSRLNEYLFYPGDYILKTTQLYKTDGKPNLINDLTGKSSEAGFNLSNIDRTQIIAYDSPMRQVSANKLSNVISPLDNRNYAIEETVDKNGTKLKSILINFIPDEKFTDDTTTMGEELVGFFPNYIIGAETTYSPLQEEFKLTYNTITNADISDTEEFQYKIELLRDADADATPIVSSIIINYI